MSVEVQVVEPLPSRPAAGLFRALIESPDGLAVSDPLPLWQAQALVRAYEMRAKRAGLLVNTRAVDREAERLFATRPLAVGMLAIASNAPHGACNCPVCRQYRVQFRSALIGDAPTTLRLPDDAGLAMEAAARALAVSWETARDQAGTKGAAKANERPREAAPRRRVSPHRPWLDRLLRAVCIVVLTSLAGILRPLDWLARRVRVAGKALLYSRARRARRLR